MLAVVVLLQESLFLNPVSFNFRLRCSRTTSLLRRFYPRSSFPQIRHRDFFHQIHFRFRESNKQNSPALGNSSVVVVVVAVVVVFPG